MLPAICCIARATGADQVANTLNKRWTPSHRGNGIHQTQSCRPGRVQPCAWCELHWRHNDHDGVSNHQPHGCLLNRLFRRRSKKTSKLRVTGLCAGNSPDRWIPRTKACNAENVSIWWRHHVPTELIVSTPINRATGSLRRRLNKADKCPCLRNHKRWLAENGLVGRTCALGTLRWP